MIEFNCLIAFFFFISINASVQCAIAVLITEMEEIGIKNLEKPDEATADNYSKMCETLKETFDSKSNQERPE